MKFAQLVCDLFLRAMVVGVAFNSAVFGLIFLVTG